VAAAVILRENGEEFLLARRPESKVYADYWEFPGGKLEAGESVYQALCRELQEELAVKVTAATPWLTRQFDYPHATVRLHFWRVTAWEGEIQPVEHSGIVWLRRGETPTLAPILPANGPIIKALALPTVMAISNIEENGEDHELTRLEEALAGGLRLFQLRDKHMSGGERLWQTEAMLALIRPRGGLLVVNDDVKIAELARADGVHLSSCCLAGCRQRPEFEWVGASCHNRAELQRAAELGLDYVLLGPVLPTPTHPEQPGLGWAEFAQLVAETPIPVLALGGMQYADLATAQAHGAHGIAMMRGW
jgi:8-oxo-dGTP diphosphatase